MKKYICMDHSIVWIVKKKRGFIKLEKFKQKEYSNADALTALSVLAN